MTDEYAGLNLIDLLERLEPIPEPEAVSLFPQTQGWVWLGALVVALLFVLARRGLRAYQANGYRRAALREVDRIGSDPIALAAILRRTALTAYPRADVASLFGADWLAFLDLAYGGTEFSAGQGHLLASTPYRNEASSAQLQKLAATWIRRHSASLPEAA